MGAKWKGAAALAVAFVALGIGLSASAFLGAIRSSQSQQVRQADGIVVLTGGDRRLVVGMALLASGVGKRLLVSGVHPGTTRDMLRRAHNLHPGSLLACCTDLGHEASDTTGNAAETRAWVERHGFRSLIVVTANYHMPRTLVELAHAMPGVELIAHPVDPRADGSGPWWSDTQMLRAATREYLKYVRCTVRMNLALLRDRLGRHFASAVPAHNGSGSVQPHSRGEGPI